MACPPHHHTNPPSLTHTHSASCKCCIFAFPAVAAVKGYPCQSSQIASVPPPPPPSPECRPRSTTAVAVITQYGDGDWVQFLDPAPFATFLDGETYRTLDGDVSEPGKVLGKGEEEKTSCVAKQKPTVKQKVWIHNRNIRTACRTECLYQSGSTAGI